MRFTLTIREEEYERLTGHLFPFERENAAYLLCGISTTDNETRLLVREVILVQEEDMDHASDRHMQIKQSSYLKAIKAAADRNLSFVFVHSHPAGVVHHSDQDDVTEQPLFRTAYNRIRNPAAIHGSLVLSSPEQPIGRVWLEDGSIVAIERIRVMGHRFRFSLDMVGTPIRLDVFSRQVLAFGEDLQKLFQHLTVGIVGMGGTGSAVAEELIRLGIGKIITADGECLEASNVTRVYGSRVRDAGTKKVEVLRRHAEYIGLGTIIEALPWNITRRSVVERFRECDIIFGCTDREWGRSILNAFALYYLIPVFDLGVRIESEGGNIKSIQARITTLIPGAACLFCRGRISADVIAAEILQETNPAEYESQRKQGYVPELATQAPAVIPYTSGVASFAINELLHRLSGYMGDDRVSTELFLLFDSSRISRNSTPAAPDCVCSNRRKWGRGDSDPFLRLTWGKET